MKPCTIRNSTFAPAASGSNSTPQPGIPRSSADAAVSPLLRFASGGVVSRRKAKSGYAAAAPARTIHPAVN